MGLAILVVVIAPVAIAQASRLERELRDAQLLRDRLISEADTAVAAGNWNIACDKGKAAAVQADKMLQLANAYHDALEEQESLEESDYEVMGAQMSVLIEEARVVGQARDAVCAKAAE
jgi:hypothetical protein